MHEHSVLVVGGGPTGLTLAGELALAGVDVAIVERRATQELAGSRAGGLHPRTLEVFDQRGIADRFLAEGQKHGMLGFAGVSLDISDAPTRFNHLLGLWQNDIERILGDWVNALRVPVYRGREVTGFAQDDDGVSVQFAEGRPMRAEYLTGCDGGRSVTRKAAGIEFPGSDPTTSSIIAVADLAEEPELGMRRDAVGIHGIGRADYKIIDGKIVYAAHGPVRIMITEKQANHTGEPTVQELRDAMISVFGTDYGLHGLRSITRFSDMARQASNYRSGRVLLAGDSAHVHPPDGGMGLQTGVQDAVNLGWKLAQVVKGVSPPSLLDTYHAERHPVGARVLRHTLAAVVLRREDERTKALREMLGELLVMDEPRKHLAADISGLGIRYELGGAHPLIGRRMPDLPLTTVDGEQRVFALLRAARPLLLTFGDPEAFDLTPWADRVRLVEAQYQGPWDLPAIGAVPAPGAVLVRPDGYVAWVGDARAAGLVDALTRWFGAPRDSSN
jgi:2-polyprenyl-6-methoxyphenol hydroxylase-like FAD-dependent oxidoreductase